MRQVSILAVIVFCSSFFLLFNWYKIYSTGKFQNSDLYIKDYKDSKWNLISLYNKYESVAIKNANVNTLWNETHFKLAKLYGILPSNKKFLTIGIPSIMRKKENYLQKTLQSLIDNSDRNESINVNILVLFADKDPKVRLERARDIAAQFSESISSGHMILIQALPEFYPAIKVTRRTFNDSLDRVMWRSKQVLDFAFLFSCSRYISDYYLILEDDVLTVPHYVTAIQSFVQETPQDWISLTFSGFYIIGRLLKAEDLDRLTEFLVMFHLEKPVDLLILQFLDLLVPSTSYVTRRIPGLFQHIGIYSSLDGKMQKAKDKTFADASRRFHFKNPPADLVTTLGTYKEHRPESCYVPGSEFFWGTAPKETDTFDIIFHKPLKINRIFINSGLNTHRQDIIKYAELKASPALKKMITDKKADCAGFETIALFEKGKVDVTRTTALKLHAKLQCIRIAFVKKHANWVIINEISIDYI